MIMKGSEFGKLLLAAGIASHGAPEAHASRTAGEIAPQEQVRVVDPIATISRLMDAQMNGWSADCRLAEPERTLSEDEARIYKRAEELLYQNIIPFLAQYESAVDLSEAYRSKNALTRAEASRKMEAVVPALYEFQRLRKSNPTIVCPLRTKRRY